MITSMFKALVATLLVLSLAGVAAAAKPQAGKAYSGTLAAPRNDIAVTFSVSASGKKVTKLRLSNVPLYCQGGGPAIVPQFANARISKTGAFKSTASVRLTAGPMKGAVGERLRITGSFHAGGSADGSVKTTYVNAPECSGTSAYSAG